MSNQKGVVSLLFLFFGIVLVLSVLGAYYLGSMKAKQEYLPDGRMSLQANGVPANSPTPGICQQYGISKDKDKLYKTYIVKKGDTLLSVAKNELKDVSRVGDLVYINREQYPGLSFDAPFIEVGWKLHLPPEYFKKVELLGSNPKLIYKASGDIIKMDLEKWHIRLNEYNSDYAININNETVFLNKSKDGYQVGDCIEAVLQEQDQKTFAVLPQVN